VAHRGWKLAGRDEAGLDPLGVTTMVFTSVGDACQWLGVDHERAIAKIHELRAQLRERFS